MAILRLDFEVTEATTFQAQTVLPPLRELRADAAFRGTGNVTHNNEVPGSHST